MDNEASWELYRSFLAVLEEGSLSGAARALGIAQPTVGRHVATLEQSLGLTLFTRSQTGLNPTEVAMELRGHAEAMKSNAAAIRRVSQSQGERVVGTVRISASEMIGVEVLPPIVAALQNEHPQLVIELVLSNRVQDVLRREADIAVRMTEPRQEQLIARSVGTVELGFHAHRRYLERRGIPADFKDLERHALIGFDVETPFLRAAKTSAPGWARDAFAIRVDSDLAQMALIRAGAGIGVCQTRIAARDPELVRVLQDDFSLPLRTWLVMHEDLRTSPRCKVAFSALLAGLQAHAGTSGP